MSKYVIQFYRYINNEIIFIWYHMSEIQANGSYLWVQ